MSDLFGMEETSAEESAFEDSIARDVAAVAKAAAQMDSGEENADSEIDLDDINLPEVEEDSEERSRKEKKRERLRMMDELNRLREEGAQRDKELAELRGRMSERQQAQLQQQGPKQDTLQQEINAAYAAHEQLTNEAQLHYNEAARNGQTMGEDKRREFTARRNALQQRINELTTKKVMRDSGIGPHDPREAARQMIHAEYRDVYEHKDQRAAQYAEAEYKRQMALGHRDSPELLRRVMTETRQRFGLQTNNQSPTNQIREKYASTGRGGGGNSGGNVVRMTKEMKNIAEVMYDHRRDLTDHQKHLLWAKENGAAYRNEERKAGR